MTLKTDKEGKAISDALLVGKYYLKETNVPDGFVQNNEVYAFEIKDEDIQGVNVDMDVFNNRASVTLDLTKVMETNHYDYSQCLCGRRLWHLCKKRYPDGRWQCRYCQR